MHRALCFVPMLLAVPQLAAAQTVVATDAMRKIKTTTNLATIPTGSAIAISSAKNEFEAFQVAVRGPATGVNGSASSLTGPGGFALTPATCGASGNIRLYREAIMNVTTQSGSVNGGTGGYPDALIPNVDEFDRQCRSAFPFDVPAGENRVVWYEVYVPPNAPAGDYSGNVVVGGTTIQVTLTVWDFALPPKASLHSYFGLSYAMLVRHHLGGDCSSPGVSQLRQRYSALALDHRISTPNFDDGCSYVDWGLWDQWMGPLLNGTGPTLMGGAKMSSSSMMRRDSDQTVYNDWWNHFANNAWSDRLFVYAGDEPGSCAPASDPWDSIPPRLDKGHAANASFRGLVVTTIEHARNPMATQCPPASQMGDLTPKINILVPNVLELDATSGNTRSQYDSWATGINEVWEYVSCMSQGCAIGDRSANAWPNYNIDANMIQARSLEWISFKNRLGGELYYDTVYAYGSGDPWTSQFYFNGNGDGTLFYPGTTDRIGGSSEIPISSLRMKMIREGMEDFEYLYILGISQNDRAWAESQVSALFPSAYQSDQDPARLYDTRKQLACRILVNMGKPNPCGSSGNVTLTIAKSGSGTGTVSSSSPPPGFSCGPTCTASYPPNTVVTLNAAPAGGSQFVNWTGGCSGSSTSCTVTMDVSKTVGAVFNTTGCSLSDCFNRPDSASLGPNWNTYQGPMQITAGQATNSTANGKAAQFLQSVGADQDVFVDCEVTGAGSNCGLMARWSDSNNHYYSYLDSGLGVVDLYRAQGGVVTRIGRATRTISANVYYRLRLLIQGSSIKVTFNNEASPAISLTDTGVSTGNYAGLHAFAGAVQSVWYSGFNVAAAPGGPAPLFSDTFDRTTGLGADWSTIWGSYTTDGAYAVSGSPPLQGNWAKVNRTWSTNNYSVVADLLIPSGSLDSGIVARSSGTNFDSDLYSAQISTDGSVYLYRRNFDNGNYTWTMLGSAAAGIAPNTKYTLKLLTTGTSAVHLEVWLNGALKISYDDAGGHTGSGVGIENYDATVKYDNFAVYAQ